LRSERPQGFVGVLRVVNRVVMFSVKFFFTLNKNVRIVRLGVSVGVWECG
jgi:hypothetical protein